MSGSGLGLADFLGHSGGSSGRAGWLRRWVDSKRESSIDVWLAARAGFHPVWKVGFIFEDLVEDSDGKAERKLKFPKFVSMEPESVCEHQYFRTRKKDLTAPLERPPTRDPFLLLREYLLLHRADLPEDTVVFRWTDRQRGAEQTIVWRKGDLTGETPREKRNWRANISPKLGYLLCVVDNENRGDGIVLTEASKGLADAIKATIKREIESLGHDEGNPLKNPYALRWKYRPDETPMKKYDAMRLSRVEYDDEIYRLINSEPPDVEPYSTPRDSDLDDIRAYMSAAAAIELPLDRIFSEDESVRVALALPPGSGQRRSAPVAPSSEGANPPPSANPPSGAAPSGDGIRRRRRRANEPPPPPPEPEEETVPCDECGAQMSATATKCPKCGEEYVLDDEPSAAPPPKEQEAPVAPPPKEAPAASGGECLLCGSGPIEDGRCAACGMDQADDDIPF